MRKKSFLFLTKSAFSFFELIAVLVILGVMSYYALPRFFVQDSLCVYQLRAKLSKANDAFLNLYIDATIYKQPTDVWPIFSDLIQKTDSQCYFEYKNKRLIARIGSQKLIFMISPPDFSSKPKIYCNLSNDLCRKFWGKRLKK